MKTSGIILGIFLFLLFNLSPIFGQDSLTSQDMSGDNITLKAEPAVQNQGNTDSEPEVQWLLGKVVSLDVNSRSLSVRYSDYDTDMEKDINIYVDNNTSYENVKSLDEIKPQDSISVDYIVSSEGKNIARNISLEKIDAEQIAAEQGSQE